LTMGSWHERVPSRYMFADDSVSKLSWSLQGMAWRTSNIPNI
jgi:hypothetical protein